MQSARYGDGIGCRGHRHCPEDRRGEGRGGGVTQTTAKAFRTVQLTTRRRIGLRNVTVIADTALVTSPVRGDQPPVAWSYALRRTSFVRHAKPISIGFSSLWSALARAAILHQSILEMLLFVAILRARNVVDVGGRQRERHRQLCNHFELGSNVSVFSVSDQSTEGYTICVNGISSEDDDQVEVVTDVIESENDDMELSHVVRVLFDHTAICDERIPSRAHKFYENYAKKVGFVIKVWNTNFDKSRKELKISINQSIHCNQKGYHEYQVKAASQTNKITATRCKAKMYVMFDREKGNWMLSMLESRHSHPCSAKKSVHYHVYKELTMHAKCVIKDNDEAGI
ncbi:hypothetical protein Ahy_A08g040923 [Arachis hypogaea]|uniref:FAR1 domain-containing protein n=1 Tax=Arachis hypogaea TaxID=3818 RepID=A0A445C126_ARAHY|nr:hypothetical protein Ahy_A08g040923 [Arachis hypogaea]